MNRKNQQILPREQSGIQQQTREKKIFSQEIFQINYLNTSKILYREASMSSDVKVNNYLCYQEGNQLRKVTEIIYEDKLIKIEDIFDVAINYEKLKQKQIAKDKQKQISKAHNSERVRIFSKSSINNGQSMKKKDKKNIVKNFVKLFLTWLQRKNNNPQHQKVEQILKQLLETQNYNNRLMKQLISHQDINKIFLNFLMDDAEDQIRHSRIQDKQSHYEAIQLYINLIKNTSSSEISSFENSQMSHLEQSAQKKNSQDKTMNSNKEQSVQ